MANIAREPLIIIQGLGVTVNPNNKTIFGKTSPSEQITISIGNNVSTTANVFFNKLTPTNETFTINNFLITPNGFTGSISMQGSLVAPSLNIGENLNVRGITKAEKIESQLSQSITIFESGSTQFGDTSDDTHVITGSFLTSGSLSLNNSIATSLTDDIFLSVGRSTHLATESGSKTYVDDLDSITKQTYVRKCFAHTGSFVDSDTFTFNAVTASAPSVYLSTRVDDFMFFVNGQLMESDALTIQQQGSTLRLDINSDNIGYDLTNDDEVVGWGKFNS
jgi:hypothetical protein